MFETFGHTADLGLRVAAPDRTALFTEAARGLLSMLVENPESVRPVQDQSLSLTGDDIEYLLFDWLSELLYRFETQHFLASRFELNWTEAGLEARASGETVDRSRHQSAHEVKAITYHDFVVRQTTDGRWEAELIVDI